MSAESTPRSQLSEGPPGIRWAVTREECVRRATAFAAEPDPASREGVHKSLLGHCTGDSMSRAASCISFSLRLGRDPGFDEVLAAGSDPFHLLPLHLIANSVYTQELLKKEFLIDNPCQKVRRHWFSLRMHFVPMKCTSHSVAREKTTWTGSVDSRVLIRYQTPSTR
jgi:hypothetical protein